MINSIIKYYDLIVLGTGITGLSIVHQKVLKVNLFKSIQ